MKTEWFSVEKEKYAFDKKPYYRLIEPKGVIILAFTKDNRIILERQFRPAVNRYTLELPSGTGNKSESPRKTAARELYEETGYRCKKLYYLGEDSVMTHRSNQRVFMFYGEKAEKTPDFIPRENIKVETVTLKDFRKLVRSGEYTHLCGLGLVLLAHFKLKKKIPL